MDYIAVLLPPIVVGLLFWFAMKSIFNADKSERQAEARAHAEAETPRQGAGFRTRRRLISPGMKLIVPYCRLGFPLTRVLRFDSLL